MESTNTAKKKSYNYNNDNESITMNFITFLESTSNNFYLMIKSHFRGSSFYLGNLLIPIIIAFGVGAFLTMSYAFVWVLFLSMTFTGMSTYGTVFFSLRKSTIIKNIDLTKTQTGSLYMSTFFLLGLSLLITLIVVTTTDALLDVMGFAIYTFQIGSKDEIYINWLQVFTNGEIWYYWIEQIFLCFSISFFIEKIVSTQKNFFICAFAYILAGIFFAGIFSNTLFLNENNEVQVIDDSTFEIANEQGIMLLEPYMWGGANWWVGQLFPHYGANQLVATVTLSASYTITENGTEHVQSAWSSINLFTSMGSLKVKYYAFAPWIWVTILLTISSNIERYKK